MELAGKKILLGVSGGIAVYKSCELLRLLQKAQEFTALVGGDSARNAKEDLLSS